MDSKACSSVTGAGKIELPSGFNAIMGKQAQQEILAADSGLSVKEEALVNLQRTAVLLTRSMQQAFRDHEITAPQYHVLRVLREAGKDGLRCSEIADRMLHADPDITRLLARLHTGGLIEQRQDLKDRRAVHTRISSAGLRKLKKLDRLVDRRTASLFPHMKTERIRLLIDLLREARAGLEEQKI